MSNQLPLRPNVCMLVYRSPGKLLLGERLSEPGVWQLPQGGVEPEHSLEDNVLRELEEELGIPAAKLTIVKKLNATHEYDWNNVPDYAVGKWRGQSQTFWLVKFNGTDSDIDLNRHTPEFMNWKWCEIREIPTVAESKRVPGYLPALNEVEELFKSGKVL